MRSPLKAVFAQCSKGHPFHSSRTIQRTLATFGSPSDKGAILNILKAVQEGHLSLPEAQDRITQLHDDGFDIRKYANLDLRRSRRVGFPEAVFAQGKTPLQVAEILDRMAKASETPHSSPILATRVSSTMMQEMRDQYHFRHGAVQYNSTAQIAEIVPIGSKPISPKTTYPRVVVVTAGTTDLPVAQEAACTIKASGYQVDEVVDAGVAGLHRILKALPILTDPAVGCVIVVAGMDGALPSVVGGLVSAPVIAVPTSIGYGASFGGVSALLTMLNSCSPGVSVVNIDNGFGAAVMAIKCLRVHDDSNLR